MLWLLTLLALLLFGLYAALERAGLTARERALSEQTDLLAESAFYIRMLALRAGGGLMAGLAIWALMQNLQTPLLWLRGLGLSRIAAMGIWLVPLALALAAVWWVAYLWGENHLSASPQHPMLVRVASAPFWPVGWVAKALFMPATNPVEDESSAEAVNLFRVVDAAPDPVWQMVQDQEGNDVSMTNRQMFDNATELSTVRVRECMIPRTDIVAIDEDEGIPGLQSAFVESGYSKIPVYRENVDQVLGYCHSSSMFKKPKAIADIMSPMMVVPESMTATQLLIEFSKEQKSIALVIDEYGGTSGLVTMEDVMEEIFGDIQDELDHEEELEVQENGNTWLLSARLEVDYLNEKYEWDLPVGDYESLGGLVISLNEDLPEPGAIVEASPFSFEVVEMEETRLRTIRLRIE